MKVEYINPFLLAAKNVFSTMVGWEIERGQLYAKNGSEPEYEVSGIIGLSGRAVGTVVLSLSREAAFQATKALLGEECTELDATVVDAVGELANMVAGSAKSQLEQFKMSISIPTVITGKGYQVQFPKDVPRICIPFNCLAGPMCLEVGFRENTSG